ncbi:MAG: hypothetical protein AB1673_14580 [Actinomycetota bacterium]|jgi:hypothetical protein
MTVPSDRNEDRRQGDPDHPHQAGGHHQRRPPADELLRRSDEFLDTIDEVLDHPNTIDSYRQPPGN